MKNKRKNIIILLILILLLTLGIGVTYAIFKWTSSNSDITFNIEGCYVTYDAGSDITGASLGPALSKDDTNNVLSKKITLSPECSGVTASLTLKVNEIAPELKHTSFIWSLYEGDTKVSNGNFADATTNKVYTLLSTKTLTENTTTTYTLYIYIDGTVDNDSSMGGKSFKFTLGASGENALYKEPTAAEFVQHLDDGTSGNDGSGVYKVEHDAIASSDSASGWDIPAITDYRYYGPHPNNYICLDMEEQSTCPDRGLFRIIGSIYEENAETNLIKVIKATPLTDGTTNSFSWDYEVFRGNATSENIWNGSTIKKLLNGIYLTRESGSYYNYSTTATTIDFANTGLTENAKKLINWSRYTLGGYSDLDLYTSDIYLAERGKTTSSGNGLTWYGEIGLIYISDVAYTAGNYCTATRKPYNYNGSISTCTIKTWFYSESAGMTMTPRASATDSVWAFYNYADYYRTDYYSTIRPVFYLKSKASITGGTGTEQDPYTVK